MVTEEIVTRDGFQRFLCISSPVLALLLSALTWIRSRGRSRSGRLRLTLFYGLIPLLILPLWKVYAAYLDVQGMDRVRALAMVLGVAVLLGLLLGRAARNLEKAA